MEELEKSLEKKYHVEDIYEQLREDYEELRKEKQRLVESFESQLIERDSEVKSISNEHEQVDASEKVLHENQRFERALEEKEKEAAELKFEINSMNEQMAQMDSEFKRLAGVGDEKQQKIE